MSAFNPQNAKALGLEVQSSDFWGSPVYINAFTGELFCPGFTGDPIMSSQWDYVIINGQQTPGIAHVGVTRRIEYDKKKPADTNGARTTVHGSGPAMVEIALVIWTPEQKRRFDQLWPQIMPIPGKSESRNFDIHHPSTKAHNVKSILVVGGHGWEDGPTAKSRIFRIEAVEYLPSNKKKATKSPIPSTPNGLSPPAVPKPGADPKNTGPVAAK